MKISVTIITLNEADNIKAACESAAWADEIVVVDANSTDQTRALAEAAGGRVIVRDWPGFSAQKQFAAEQARNDWILSLDADERVSAELSSEISELAQQSESDLADAYLIPRRSFYQGRWIRGGGWYPDKQLRLYRKSRGSWRARQIHESVKMNAGARVSELKHDILHYSVKDAAHHHRMIGERYAPLAAAQMLAEGRRTSALKIATAAPAAFVRSFVLRGGFRDGLAGLSIASFAAHHAFLKQLMLWELQHRDQNE